MGWAGYKLGRLMADLDFSSFLFAAAVAGVGVGGTLLVTWTNSDKETTRRLAVLETQAGEDRKKIDWLIDRAQTTLTLDLRVRIIEDQNNKQERALEDLRQFKVPRDSRESR